MLAVAYGANLGGMGTKLGTPANSVFAGFVARKLGHEVGFLEFLAVGLPAVLLLLPLAWVLLWRVGRADAPRAAQGTQAVVSQLAALGPPGRAERTVGALFAAAALLWILGDPLRALLAPKVAALGGGFALQAKHYEAAVAMAAALTALALGRLPLAALRRVPWDTLLLLGGGFALAAGIEGSGLSIWLSGHLGGLAALPLGTQLLAAAGSTILLSALASNTATVNVMLNVVPGSLPVLAVTTLASSCDFALPAGTPPNAIVFGSGYVHLPTMMRVGLLLDGLCALVLTLYGLTWVRFVLG
jgi:solute carrier family 13 (sodium-dependent dicarboxylate transporter), member 2/3/5